MLSLFDFQPTPRHVAKTTLQTDAELGRLLDLLQDDPKQWVFDYDPLWRELILFVTEPSVLDRFSALHAQSCEDPNPVLIDQYGVEVIATPGEGISKRTYTRNKKTQSVEVRVQVAPSAPGQGLLLEPLATPLFPVLAHGVRRSARLGPGVRYLTTDGQVTLSLTTTEAVPPLADLHAAATHAMGRALQNGGTQPCSAAPDRQPLVDPHPFPEVENSAAETFLNLLEIFSYPVDTIQDEERGQLAGFIAYQVSLIFGHQLDERMRRQPAQPPTPMRRMLTTIAGWLLERARADGRPGAEMVRELVEMWIGSWKDQPSAADVAASNPVAATHPLAPEAELTEEEEEDSEDESGC